MQAISLLTAATLALATAASARDLEIYFIDVEGGQSTLILTPAGESLLVDAGWPARYRAGANRVLAVAEVAGIKNIDYLLVTHYHLDHVGGVPDLAGKLPVGTYLDHGPTVETDNTARVLWNAYEQAAAKAKRIVVKPGDRIPLKGIDVTVAAARGETIRSPLKGAGAENPVCASIRPAATDTGENARSVGFLLKYGRFRFADLADLTWQKENTLVCPKNLLGEADLFLVSNHSLGSSNSPAVIAALRPRVAVTNNGERTGAWRLIWSSLRQTPGFEDIWQLHYAEGIRGLNAPEDLIANPRAPENCDAHWIKVMARPDASFTVTNSRNKFTKTYRAKDAK